MNRARGFLAPLTYAGLWVWSADVLNHDWQAHTHFLPGQGPGIGRLILAARVAAIVTSGATGLWLAWRQRNRWLTTRSFFALLYSVVFALFIASIAQPWLPPTAERWITHSIFLASLGLAQIAWTLHWGRAATPPSHPMSTGRVVVFKLVVANIVATLVLAEIALALFAVLLPSPLVFRDSVAEHLEAMRQPAHASFHDGKLNRGEYADDEFFSATRDDLVVALLADSFGLGVVPLRHNFVSVTEGKLRSEFDTRYARRISGWATIGRNQDGIALRTANRAG